MLAGALPLQATQAAPPRAAVPAPAAAPVPVAPTAATIPAVGAAATPVIARVDLPEGGRRYSVTLKQLGARIPMVLRGIEGSSAVPFAIRADEVVSSAKLTLKYAYSPALLADLSHINVMVNGEVAATVPVPKVAAGTNQEITVDLPPPLITQFNTLNIQLIGHYTMECEDPLHTSLWANISNRSVLEVTVSPLALVNDLSILPLPFFDRRDASQLRLPFIFNSAPDNGTLEAAGALSSWFGGLATYRGAKFPVSTTGEIPTKGNAVIVATGALQSAGIDVPAPNGPTVTIVPNPNDQFGKLLIVGGRDAKELKQAALAVVTGNKTLTGQRAVITQLLELEKRVPYDAPNWLRSDRPVKLGELATPETLNVTGFSPRPIAIDMRLPPDLFGWREKGVPLNLKYRYTPQPISTNSSLTVGLNDQFIKSIHLPSVARLGGGEGLLERLKSDSSIPVTDQMVIPLQIMNPRSQLQLQLRYQYDYIKQGECRDVIIDNVRGAIEPDSTIDISSFSHYIAMPNLGVFNDSGFPFTKMADLSQTAVVLPNNAGPAEFSAYLSVLGRFSESTGYPATAVTVARPDQAPTLADKDLLVIASGDNQPLLKQWAKQLPMSLDGPGRRFELSDLIYRTWNWLMPNPRAAVDQARNSVSFTTDGASVVLVGFESPLQAGRSVVAISSSRPEGLEEAVNAMIGGEEYPQTIQGSVAVIRDKQVDSLVADQTYAVGSLGLVGTVQWYMSRHPWLVVLLGILGIALLCVPIYLALRARARQRLGS
ncbi:cellulose biosynthesis cyclic di-GMP-binding regulatory protein BcsB [Pigmentiphaga aceris]|uniref:Cyclic di-GMP-binding protein n=2 Tax=Pigmentiphaga aceris TaxID=1940612 RepID=A0A5C0B757_9BURK|nr:cellulose biosynthesis cyclic di-GMP-binding regulatory protein BcsB [Pigmentiphaga aceris]